MVRLSLLAIISLALASTSASASEAESESCPLWIAPSYINKKDKKQFKYGLFAGRTYDVNETLPLQELAIPLVDFFVQFNKDKPLGKKVINTLQNYVWNENSFGTQFEGKISAPPLIPGIGMHAQMHSSYANADWLEASVVLREYDDSYPKAGEASLQRGAITPYFNATLLATAKIPAGMEILAYRDQNWDDIQSNIYQDKIRGYDYQLADKVIDKLLELFEKHPDLSLDMKEDVMEFLLQKVLATGAGPDGKSISSLIPENPRKLQQVKDAGGTFMHRYRDMVRPTEWLEDNGFCLNTIRQGVSTIPNAGRGAFANRDIKEGENVIVTPLMHVVNKNLLALHPIVDDEFVEQEEPTKAQILLNYVFGHEDSDMVFIPTAPHVMLINHGGKEANAHIAWATEDDEIYNRINYFSTDLEGMSKKNYPVMIMKVVADRDIAEGEEITIDYGDSWQAAWNEYEANWRKYREGEPHPLKAEDVKQLYKDKPLETKESLNENPYPEGVSAACYIVIEEFDDGMPMSNPKNGEEILDFSEPTVHEEYDGTILFEVEVLERIEAPGFFYNYTVRAELFAPDTSTVHNVPHSACTFIDQNYTSDLHMEGAFRHPIGLPDGMVPILWRFS